MGKIFETDSDIVKMVEEEFANTGLDRYGLNLKVMSLQKAKDVIKVTKASPATEFLAKKDSIIQMFIYEDAFNSLDEECQKFLIKMALSGVAFDSEKDKILIESNPYQYLFNMRQSMSSPNRADELLEASYAAIKQLEEKEKEEKQREKEAKLSKKN